MKDVITIFNELGKREKSLRTYIISNLNHKLYPTFKQLNIHEINALLLLSVNSPTLLSRLLFTTKSKLENLINYPNYKHYTIPKKKGGVRHIFAPSDDLKVVQKSLNFFLQAYYLCIKPKEVHGFVINPRYLDKNCNIVANAQMHTQKKQVLNIDIKDFFPSINIKQVKNLFTSSLFQFDENIANALTFITTYQGKLPAGAPTSPAISNFICLQLDQQLREFCKNMNITYSRYADDLSFSSNNPINTDIILDLINIINANGFSINEKKLRIASSSSKQTVTGLVVNEKVNIDRKTLKKIRAMLHHLKTQGIEAATKKHFNIENEVTERQMDFFINRLEGYINFVGQVRGKKDALYIKFKLSFQEFYQKV